MRNFLLKKMAVATIMLSSTAFAHAEQQLQDFNDLDVVINNLIKVRSNEVPAAPVAAQNGYSVNGYNVSNTGYTNFSSQQVDTSYSNPFLKQNTALSGGSGIVSEGTAPHKMAMYASRMALSASASKCALYVRKALQAAGYNVRPQSSAYMYNNGEMVRIGFNKIPKENYQPQVGDVIVFNRTPTNPHGHIQIYSGSQWVSDFKQPRMMIYGDNHRGYTIYRDARYIDASMKSNTTYLAMNN